MTFVLHALEFVRAPNLVAVITARVKKCPTEAVAIVRPPLFSCLPAQTVHFLPLPRLFGSSSPRH